MGEDPFRLGDDARPRRDPSVRGRSVGSDTLLVHSLLKQYHVLNAVAARIWELSDGQHTPREMADIIALEYKEDSGVVYHDVVETLQGLGALRLIVLAERG